MTDFGNGVVPKTIPEFLQEISVMEDGKKLAKLNGYVFELEQEMEKIRVFKRELPVCMLLLGDAIDRLKEEVVQCKGRKGKTVMMMGEIIPIGGNSYEDGGSKGSADLNEKKNWMSSAQLWTTSVDNNHESIKIQDSSFLYQKSINQEDGKGTGKRTQLASWNEINRGGAFVPFKKPCAGSAIKEDDFPRADLSLCPPVARGRYGDSRTFIATVHPSLQKPQLLQPPQPMVEEPEQQQQPKKQRRSWSPDLHRRFVNALEQLGGAQVATPKQIRELMQVADLTNDEVKSHLQKYRLLVRKMSSASSGSSLDLKLEDVEREGVRWQQFKMAQSASPEGPLNLGGSLKGFSVSHTIGEVEDGEDEKSEIHSWDRKDGARSR